MAALPKNLIAWQDADNIIQEERSKFIFSYINMPRYQSEMRYLPSHEKQAA